MWWPRSPIHFPEMGLSPGVKSRQLAADAPALLVACGLAMRRFDARFRINLLPHRAAKRALRKREFNLILLGTPVGVAALWVRRQALPLMSVSHRNSVATTC